MSLIKLSATKLLDQLAAGEVTSTEITEAFLAQIDAHDANVRAFIRVNRDAALQRAAEIDGRRKRDETVGALGGLPVAAPEFFELACRSSD